MAKKSILDYTKAELAGMVKPSFRAKQIWGWIYHQYATSFETMANLPKAMREELDQTYEIMPLKIARKECSSDGTIKYLFELSDGKTVETVWLKMKDESIDDEGTTVHEARFTVCVSTQVGCKVGCSFCLTARGGFTRDLERGGDRGAGVGGEDG
jgi:23S rRNA (adenine2503-C2)-methyltransferase